MIPSALIYIIVAILVLAALLAWAIVRGGSDDYEPIENGGDKE